MVGVSGSIPLARTKLCILIIGLGQWRLLIMGGARRDGSAIVSKRIAYRDITDHTPLKTRMPATCRVSAVLRSGTLGR